MTQSISLRLVTWQNRTNSLKYIVQQGNIPNLSTHLDLARSTIRRLLLWIGNAQMPFVNWGV
jgi:hypothetical protein